MFKALLMLSTEEQIWKDFEESIEDTTTDFDTCLCKHDKKYTDCKEKSEICQDCGVVFFNYILVTNEWNKYKN